MANLHSGGNYSCRGYGIKSLTAKGVNAKGEIVFEFPNGDLTEAVGNIYWCEYNSELTVLLNEHPVETDVVIMEPFPLEDA